MALMLPARARGETAARGACNLPTFPPLSVPGWHGQSRPARAIRTDQHAWPAPRPFHFPRRQLSPRSLWIPRRLSRRQQLGGFAGRCAWKR